MNPPLLSLLLICFAVGPLQAQDQEDVKMETLLDAVESNGVYGAISFDYTTIDDRDGFMIGVRGCWVANHSMALGLGAKGFFTEYHYDPLLKEDANLQGLYGGLHIEPILAARDAIHFAFPLLIGGGRVAHAGEYTEYHYYENNINDTDGFFLIEPGVELEANMFEFFRISLGAFYRYTNAIQLYDTADDALNGFHAGLILKFGFF